LLVNFNQIWNVAAAINTKQFVLKLYALPDVCVHLVMLQENCDNVV